MPQSKLSQPFEGRIVTFLKAFRKSVGIKNNDKKGNTNVKDRVAIDLDKTYNNAMEKVFEEVGSLIDDRKYRRIFFNDQNS